jgi:hypothetical protein
VFDLPLLETLVHAGLDLFAKSVHLVGLSLDESGLSSHDLLVTLLHVPFTFLFLRLESLDLDLVSVGILLLAGELALDLL